MTWQACGYGCGAPWRPFAGTRLKGHVRCAIPAAAMEELLEVRERFAPRLTDVRMASDLGVPLYVLRAWFRLALRRRGERRDLRARAARGA